MSLAEAGPLGCAGVAAFGTTMRAGFAPGDLVSVVGVGGLGHLAVQYAALAGARVAAVDIDDAKLAIAADLGAEVCINPLERIRPSTFRGSAVPMRRSSSLHPESTISQGLRSLRRDGTFPSPGGRSMTPCPRRWA